MQRFQRGLWRAACGALFAVGATIAAAQAPPAAPADSVEDRVAAAAPAERSGIYLDAARTEKSRNLDRARELASAALTAAGADVLAAFEARLLLVDVELTARKPDAAEPLLAALEAAAANAPLQSRLGDVLYLRGRWLRDQRRDDEAASAFERSVELAAAAGDGLLQAKGLHAHAMLKIRQGAQADAEVLLERALRLNEEAGREREADANRHYLGLIARDRGAYARALQLHLETLAHSEARGDQQGIANSANAIGILQAHLGQNEQALLYYQRALAAFRQLGDRYGEVNALANSGEILTALNRLAEARQTIELAISIAAEQQDADAEALARLILANVLVAQQHFDQAEREASTALRLASAHPADLRVFQALGALAGAYQAQGRKREAIPLLERALDVARSTGRRADQHDTLVALGRLEASVGELEPAAQHLDAALTLQQGIQDEEMTRRLAELRAQHDAEKREAEIAAQKARIGLLEDQALQQQRVRYLLAAALLSAALLVLALISRARTKHKAERELRAQNALIEKANADLALAAETDSLTQLRNRRHFQRALAPAIEAAQASQRPFALVLIDADRFKSINDAHGHDCGDAALVAISDAWRSALTPADTLMRWGGEEFLAVLFDQGAAAVAATVARGLAAVRATRVAGRDGPLALSVSAGWLCGPWPGAETGWLLQLADRALLQAKRDGRDRGYGLLWQAGAPAGGALPEALEQIPGARIDQVA